MNHQEQRSSLRVDNRKTLVTHLFLNKGATCRDVCYELMDTADTAYPTHGPLADFTLVGQDNGAIASFDPLPLCLSELVTIRRGRQGRWKHIWKVVVPPSMKITSPARSSLQAFAAMAAFAFECRTSRKLNATLPSLRMIRIPPRMRSTTPRTANSSKSLPMVARLAPVACMALSR